jgi:hypothetical protein
MVSGHFELYKVRRNGIRPRQFLGVEVPNIGFPSVVETGPDEQKNALIVSGNLHSLRGPGDKLPNLILIYLTWRSSQ